MTAGGDACLMNHAHAAGWAGTCRLLLPSTCCLHTAAQKHSAPKTELCGTV